jgi:nicotinamidase-related amidase
MDTIAVDQWDAIPCRRPADTSGQSGGVAPALPSIGLSTHTAPADRLGSKGIPMNPPYIRLDRSNAAVLLVDHQTGLLSLVRDIDPDKFKNNVLALADLARYFKLPTILTTSFENGPNGPLVPELKEIHPHAPFIARPGQINAWDNDDFLQAVKATGKKQLIIAGVVTEVCVAFPALSARAAGYDVFVVTDASGTFNPMTRDSAWSRMTAAGVQLLTWFATACELHRDWRNDVEGLGALFSNHIPDYRNLINSYTTLTKK